MPLLDIQKEFVDGVQEIFTTLFNDNSSQDGVYFYPLKDQKTNVYGEQKYKTYKSPKLLVCKAILNPTYGEQTVLEVKDQAEFVVPLKSLQNAGLEVTHKGLVEMRRGILRFKDAYYIIDNIVPKSYVEDVFLMYRFICTEDVNRKDPIHIEEDFLEDQTLNGEDTEVL